VAVATVNNCEAGVVGNTILTTDPGSPDPWSATSLPSGAILQYDNTALFVVSGNKCIRMRSGSGAQVAAMQTWAAAASAYGRCYFGSEAIPSASPRIVQVGTGAPAMIGQLVWDASGTSMSLWDGTNSFKAGSGTALNSIIAGNKMLRAEWNAVVNGTSTGTFQCRIFDGHSTTIAWDSGVQSCGIEGATVLSTFGQVVYGMWPYGSATSPSGTTYLYFDEMMANTPTWPGPSAVAQGTASDNTSKAGMLGEFDPILRPEAMF